MKKTNWLLLIGIFILSFILSILLFSFMANLFKESEPSSLANSSVQEISSPAPASSTIEQNQKYGHLAYAEALPTDLIKIGSYGQGEFQRFEYLHKDAAAALMKMISTARDEAGIWIVPVSGFRDRERQTLLWQNQVARQGSEELAARSSAPPGYSEHHTGYAIDLTDGTMHPDNDISSAFANSKAYAWLKDNAKRFDFELSFPENNTQGVKYEPWHWRYVGTPTAQQVFALARQQSVSAQ